MSDHIRWGVLGASNFAANHMAPALHAAAGGTFAALATRAPEKAERFRAINPDLRVHETYESLLADPDVDAVYIPLPHTMHVDWSLKAVAAGKHVLCEKPIAMSAGEIAPLIDARDSSGKLVAEAYMIVHHPQWDRMRALVAEGAIGDMRHISAQFVYNNAADPANIRNSPATGGGSLPDIGVYTIGAMRWLTGREPEVMFADITRENGLEVTTRTHLRFGEISADSLTSMRMDRHQQLTVYGTEGRLHMTAPFNPRDFGMGEVILMRGKAASQTWRYPGEAQYENQVASFNTAALTGAPFRWTLEDARGTQAALDAILTAGG